MYFVGRLYRGCLNVLADTVTRNVDKQVIHDDEKVIYGISLFRHQNATYIYIFLNKEQIKILVSHIGKD